MSTCVGGFLHADVFCNCMSVFLVSAGVFVVAWAVVQVCSTQGWAVLITFCHWVQCSRSNITGVSGRL